MPSVEIEPEVQEPVVPGDISVHEGPLPVTWQVVNEATKKYNSKLYNGLGYSYMASTIPQEPRGVAW